MNQNKQETVSYLPNVPSTIRKTMKTNTIPPSLKKTRPLNNTYETSLGTDKSSIKKLSIITRCPEPLHTYSDSQPVNRPLPSAEIKNKHLTIKEEAQKKIVAQ